MAIKAVAERVSKVKQPCRTVCRRKSIGVAAPKQYTRKNKDKWFVNNLTQTDTYKFGMCQCVFHKHPNEKAYWEFKLRSEGVDLTPFYEEINKELDHLCTLKFTEWEL
jgi:hypothetical protein